ncbi:DEAD/DEAH box helicase family protein [Desertifilum sp. FACHB-1129]|uniref:Restriction endonuclease n=1 Tax=Desertifilum tharense IPPAS B-1220 TaxID=1781255 RepID=A0A1E5QFX6_9CYAN|nr:MULTISPECIES: DEAD/DEAH box helicase family protein [Desertifilum]MDA0213639.1 DEAD/DEAH box helicase family protein [Cyanobacteria bacterium FC1]MBD2314120.1 DEAD/DEAH box helicase family protein [Desertifilum sp. FACHB-1129]MBD2323606.1 DEAD/DEAH box helicase family protein [Desertifilum sp. FACHB-866]MBD2335058.1 DEAD/DEAH box helicase family protein [Desertifilum sp. FACHB-868]OEJ73585.1 restriction endonuclease [Desertifilum tharense IPPAS B-1220]
MSKKDLSEADICDRYITPALDAAGWKKNQIRREYSFTDGQMIVRGQMAGRGARKRADYLLYYSLNQPIAVIEAKDNHHSVRAGIQQALAYAEVLQVPFVFSSNGDAFLFHDRSGTYAQVEQQISLDAFPSPEELWQHYQQWQDLQTVNQELLTSPYYLEIGGKEPRYYQQLAVNRTIEAIARGQKRCLLVMATGAGKTYTVFNIIWRLWKTKVVRRVLFLADRNALVDQTITNDFRPFGEVMTKLDRRLVDHETGRINTSYQIYLGLYQAIIGNEERDNLYDKFDRDFFDLVVVDECHRGSAAEDSNWRQVLDYFSEAIQVGLTATPKETKYISNIDYFGEPIFQYSLKQGIEDGFLAPFRRIQVDLDIDLDGWTPEAGEQDDNGQRIEQRDYNLRDYDRNIVFGKRDRRVAEYVSQFLHDGDPMRKTIVFCEDVDHAERMREALARVKLNRELVLKNHRYVMQITGDEKEGKAQIDNFINPKETYPVIATTSKLMTTGVDAQTCHVIVLDRSIQSLTEFKQIIGRGTRLRPDYGKNFFTIIDFRNASQLFDDPDWDGPPIQDENFGKESQPGEMGTRGKVEGEEVDTSVKRIKYRVSRQEFEVAAERVSYYNKDGQLTTESLKDYTRRTVSEAYQSLDRFLNQWDAADRKQAIIDELEKHGAILAALEDMVGKDYDLFDLVCHVAFDRPPLTRKERAEKVRKRDAFAKYGETARRVLNALLDKYADQGIIAIEDTKILQLDPFAQLGTPVELVRSFGGKPQYKRAIQELGQMLYSDRGA